MSCRWETVAVLGVGLLGGSVGLGLLEQGLAHRVIGLARRRSTLNQARRQGAITSGTLLPEKAVQEAQLIVVCTPVEQIAPLVVQALRLAPPEAIITDVGSVKSPVVQAVWEQLPREAHRFVPAHPLAGSQHSGPRYAKADLFRDRVTVLTPVRGTSPPAVREVQEFWRALGSRTLRLSPQEHDRRVAWTSHLPHVVAAALATTVPVKWQDLAGTGFRDTTRVAAGDAQLWTQILLQNAAQVHQALATFQNQVQQWLQALEHQDRKRLTQLLQKAKRHRDAVGS